MKQLRDVESFSLVELPSTVVGEDDSLLPKPTFQRSVLLRLWKSMRYGKLTAKPWSLASWTSSALQTPFR